MSKTGFGTTKDGKEVFLYELSDGILRAKVSDYGATLVTYEIEKDGQWIDVALGFDSVTGYEEHNDFFGATVGRNANRISDAAFELNGKKYQLVMNDKTNNHHSGPDCYNSRIWSTEGVSEDGKEITFALHSPDGDQGMPGNMDIRVTYRLTEQKGLQILMHTESDADTISNFTNHSYFNLEGEGSGLILDQELQIFADSLTTVNEKLVPDGELLQVEGTPFDFRVAKKIGAEIGENHRQLNLAGGYDHNFVLSDAGLADSEDVAGEESLTKRIGAVKLAATAYCYESGIRMDVRTNLPGLQFYPGNFIGSETGKGGATYGRRSGFALEPQFFPNSINEPKFYSPILRAGEACDVEITYHLSLN